MNPRRIDILNILAIVLVWILMELLVNPFGDFPLNDDWAYGRSVQILIEKGDFRLPDWTAANLFSQILWGALFCLPFGFSFTALRFSTLTLGLAGVIATYGLLREVETSPKLSLLGSLVLAFNPIYFELSNTFMNDVPFFAFTSLSFYFLLRGLKYGSVLEVTIGMLITYLAILARQAGLVIPVAFGCAYLTKNGIRKSTLLKGFWPAALAILIQISYQKWLQATANVPHAYGDQIRTIFQEASLGIAHFIGNFFQVGLIALVYLGLFLFPVLVVIVPTKLNQLPPKQKTRFLLRTFMLCVVLLPILFWIHRLMPLAGNVLVDFGLGPAGLSNSFQPNAPPIFWVLVTSIGVVSAALILQCLLSAILEGFTRQSDFQERKWVITFVVSSIILYSVPMTAMGRTWRGFYDRYLIVLLPLVTMVILLSKRNLVNQNGASRMTSAVIIVLLYGGFTVGATHDYLSANRARWMALHELMDREQITPQRIQGGFEFNGWYLYKEGTRISADKRANFSILRRNDNADYLISFRPINNYREIKRYPFSTWLAPGQSNILVLKKL
ncbi:glycosyltransferase family 39 protein [bacterium]|nr:glycosyltransferase family 39 protein [bacterium]